MLRGLGIGEASDTVYAEVKKQNMPTLLISYIRRFLLWHALTGCRTRGSRHLGYDYFEHY